MAVQHRHLGRPTPTLLHLSWSVFAVLTVLFGAATLLGMSLSLREQSLLYLGLMGSVSLLHGGFEHVENLRGRGESFQARYVAAYLLLTGGTLGLFYVAPLLGLAVALLVMFVKAGHGGVRVLEHVHGGDHLRTRPQRWLAVFVRGGAVLLVPLVAHPGIYYMVASFMVGLFSSGSLPWLDWLVADGTLLAVAVGYGLALAVHLGLGYARADGRLHWGLEAAETLLLVCFFLVVPPILAIGVYFPLWYAARQTARYGGESLAATAGRVLRGGTIPWLWALAILGGAWFLLPNPPTTAAGWMAYYSVFVSVIALPHVVVGEWLDRTQGIWET